VEPTSLTVLMAMVLAAVALPVATLLLYLHRRRLRRLAPLLLTMVVLSQVAAVGAVAVAVNRQYGLYPTWRSLLGTEDAGPPVAVGGLGVGTGRLRLVPPAARGLVEPASNQGRYEQVSVVGAVSRIRATVTVWLPPQYFDRRERRARFPVVMVLGGAYSGDTSVFRKLGFAALANAQIRAGKVAPFVAVYPQLNVALPTDTECIDFPGGVQSYSWLAHDVPLWARAHLRVTSDARRWSVMGWSTGGYCAAKLHLRSPGQFAAAASVEGYFEPEPDQTTADLAQVLRADPVLARENTLSWVIRHHPPAHTHLLVCTSMDDPQSKAPSLSFLKAAQGVPGVQPYILRTLGHSMPAFKDVSPDVLSWLAAVADA